MKKQITLHDLERLPSQTPQLALAKASYWIRRSESMQITTLQESALSMAAFWLSVTNLLNSETAPQEPFQQ